MSDTGLLDALRPARARVDLDRLAANYKAVAAAVPVPVMPVVKADAYGHGAVVVGRRLEALGVPALAVAFVEEAVALRQGGVRIPILVLAGFTPGQIAPILEHDLSVVVSTPLTLAAALQAAERAERPLVVHLKVDTGMSRLGFGTEGVLEAALRLAGSDKIRLEGLMTHLACADEEAETTRRQLDRFDEALHQLERNRIRPRWIHACNSAGLAFFRPSHTLVRPGLILYGVRPRPLSPPLDVRPVMTVSAQIALVKEIPAGTPVSYGGRWVAPRSSRVATVPLGYADGVPRTRAMAESGQLSVRHRRVPVRGTVCMDLIVLDLTDHPEAGESDEAVLFGDDPTAWEVADWAGTNGWQVLVAIGSRVPRVYVEGGRIVDVQSRYAR